MPFNPNGNLKPTAGYRFYVPDHQLHGAENFVFIPLPEHTIFSVAPSVNDIAQSCLGNCYLIATLLAIADKPEGQNFINNMITDLFDKKRVLVRLFNIFTTPNEPVYIEIDKSVLLHKSQSDARASFFIGHKQFWVYFIEKSYAAYRLQFRDEFLKIDRQRILYREAIAEKQFPTSLKVKLATPETLTLVKVIFEGTPSEAFKVLLGGNDQTVGIAISIKKITATIQKEVQDKLSLPKYTELFPHKTSKRGSQLYTDEHIFIYKYIHLLLSKNYLTTISSQPNIGRTNRDIVPSQPESSVKGLRKSHTYQIINCYERAGYKFILIRNPEGWYGRDYTQKLAINSTTLSAHATSGRQPFQPVQPSFPIVNPAIPFTNVRLEVLRRKDFGVFEITIEDVIKRFFRLTFSDSSALKDIQGAHRFLETDV